jgi:hypothetical protein
MSAEVENANAHPPEQDDEHLDNADENVDVDADHDLDDLADAKPKKKRRIIKTSDKKFNCPEPTCGKSYSREC